MFCDYVRTVEIDERSYTITIELSGDIRLISINNRILKVDTQMHFKHLFYEVLINKHKITIGVHANKEKEFYEIFIDEVSLDSGKNINIEKEQAKNKIQGGFLKYAKENFVSILKREYMELVTIIFFGFAFILWHTWKEKILYILLGLVILPLFVPIIIGVEYLETKRMIKKWDNQFQISIEYDELPIGEAFN